MPGISIIVRFSRVDTLSSMSFVTIASLYLSAPFDFPASGPYPQALKYNLLSMDYFGRVDNRLIF